MTLGLTASAQQQKTPVPIQSTGNPILSDGSSYSADPAPLVDNGTLYILAGTDEAPPGENDFIMNRWQMFLTKSVASHHWLHVPDLLRPEEVFRWASPGRAYAGQIVKGPDGRFYLYAPVEEAASTTRDHFAIGVAVAPSPLGPWTDAHPAGPIVSQRVPVPNDIQNIDPTAMVDDDGRVYLYYGTFGRLLGLELANDMVTPIGTPVEVTSLKGFFEAAWLFRRKNTYYMVYADNQPGPHSPCTPTVYHACIAYGTAPTALGPWTYAGVILPPVSSTTSHPGVIEFKGKWYLVYHTADARGGGNFRRSVAIDKVQWDDRTTPAKMLPVTPTLAMHPKPTVSRNIAGEAHASASNEPVPVQYWMAALNDGKTPENPLPPEMWGSWTPHNPASQWVRYTWPKPVTLNEAKVWFWADHTAGADEGVAPPAAWTLQYWTGSAWAPVMSTSPYTTAMSQFNDLRFNPVTTRCLRLNLTASGNGKSHAALAIKEWEALTVHPRLPRTAAAAEASTGDPCPIAP